MKTKEESKCWALFGALQCQEKGALSSWKSRSLFCWPLLSPFISKTQGGSEEHHLVQPHTAAAAKSLLHKWLLQFEHYDICTCHPGVAFLFPNLYFMRAFLTAFWPQIVFFCYLFLHELLDRRSVRSQIVKGLPWNTWNTLSLPSIMLKPCVDGAVWDTFGLFLGQCAVCAVTETYCFFLRCAIRPAA